MERTDLRLLSSLRDLRLQSKCGTLLTEERKRNGKRLCPIKVSPEDEEIYEEFQIIDKKKNLMDISFISKSLSQHFTFSALIADRTVKDQLVEKFRLCKVDEGEYLIRQNDNASSFFILQDGELQVQINKARVGTIKNGEGFGELALLYSTPRSASIIANTSSYLWFIDRATFRNIVSTIIQNTLAENKKFISQNSFFSYLTETQKEKIASIAITQKYEIGVKICKEGELASAMFIIKSGKLARSVNGLCIGFYKSGDSLEEYVTLQKNGIRKETITAEQTTELIALGADQIQKSLGRSLPIIILRNKAKNALLEDKHFKMLNKEFVDKLIDCFKIQKFEAEDYAYREGDFCKNKIMFIIEGKCVFTNNAVALPLYGTQAILEESRLVTFSASCKFVTDGKIARTSIEQIEEAFGCTINEAIEKSNSIKRVLERKKSKLQDVKNLCKHYELKDFEVIKKLGEGQFGQVFLVTHKSNKKLYALKCISKAETLRYKLEKHLINEKKVLESHSSAFTVDFIRSFNDLNYVYFLTEFIDGLQLFDALRLVGLVPSSLAEFYSAIIVFTLESLHRSGIVYRDLKPENIMVAADGYLKIIDMGTCKNLKGIPSQKTFTIIGTPNYMAPEIISGKGYGYSVDLWSLGVIIFQFLSGYLPFGENCDDPYEIYEEILKNQLKFPKYMKDPAANNLIVKLLNRSSEGRINGSDLKNHEFFKKIEWHKLIEKSIQPVFKPPKQSLLKIEKVPKNLKPIDHFLKHVPQSGPKRPDVNPNWDSCF